VKVRFQQTGGFAGLSRGCELESRALPRKDAEELERLIAAAQLDKVRPGRSRGADRQQYDLVVEREDGAPLELRFDDGALSDELARLVAFLRARSKPMPPR
jgi:hypothetical protein